MSLGFAKLLLTTILLASLAGCGDATVAVCFGSAEFCNNFVRDNVADPEDEDPPTNETALAVAMATPQAVDFAVSDQSMDRLARADPDLVGLWLTAATLGQLKAPNNLTITEFLDLNRAWLSEATATGHSATFDAGLTLFAAFAASRDPALATTAQLQVSQSLLPTPTGVAAEDENDVTAHASSLLGSYDADRCCQADELAAAAISLCRATPSESPTLDAAVSTACANSMTWMAVNIGLRQMARR